MNWDTIKSLLLSSWTRYGTSWVLHLLVVYLGYDTTTATTLAGQIAAGVGAGIAILVDLLHARMTHANTVTKATVAALAPTAQN